MDLLAQIDALAAPTEPAPTIEIVPPGVAPESGNILAEIDGRRAPGGSADLERILALPRRSRDDVDIEAMVELMTRRLRLDRGPCDCAARKRKCITRLNGVQGWALYEMGIVGGLIGPIGVGSGKTAINIFAPLVLKDIKTAVLLTLPGLVQQFIAEYELWRNHWKVPSLIPPRKLVKHTRIEPGEPALHVIPYSQLSRPEFTTYLESLEPDLIIADESHSLRNPDTARTSRFLRAFVSRPEAKFGGWSGSLTDKSIKDYAHLTCLALGEGSPLPIDPATVIQWACVIDPPPPGGAPAPMGSLAKLCKPGESLRDAFRKRFLDTPGVVSTRDAGIPAELRLHKCPVDVPKEIRTTIAEVRGSWTRPDGEEFVDAFAVIRCVRELASGFYHRWIFPKGEPESLIKEWFETRKSWKQEVRAKLEGREPHLDQPLLLAQAARRYHGDDPRNDELPSWGSIHWPAWRDIRDRVKPKTEAVWLSDFLVRSAAQWAEEHRGIIWYRHTAFGAALAEYSGLPLFAGGKQAAELIKSESGDRPIIASVRAHGTGRDGLQRLFSQQLVSNPPQSARTGGAAEWEQLLGRLHREGQDSSRVDTWIYRHTSEIRDAWDRALEMAQYITGTLDNFQKVLAMRVTWE